MKINGSYYKAYTSAVYNAERYNAKKINNKKSGIQGDTVEISDDALKMARVNSQEISREERIAALQKQVQSGKYMVNIEAIADKIIERIA